VEIVPSRIPGLMLIKPKVFGDDRGSFCETFSRQIFVNAGITEDFVQDNQSVSKANVLRGLHFQAPPHAQAKLVRVTRGAVLDVALDIRKGSPTYGQHEAVLLSAENNLQFYIPAGFAHGFVSLEDHTVFQYKCSAYYHKASEGCVLWNDPALNINWNVSAPLLSPKDLEGVLLQNFDSPFSYK
jgi:dTDP-4-dehydrorhamnose 3,5-epimerase